MNRRLLSYGLAAGVIALDRATKLWIEKTVPLYDVIPVIPGFFDIVHTQNRGMAFGLFADSPGAWRTFLLTGVAGVVLCVVAVLIWRIPKEPASRRTGAAVSLGLILGGAIGNLYDRILRGSVTDFLDFYIGQYHWPAFNVADSAITVGALLMALGLFLQRPDPKH